MNSLFDKIDSRRISYKLSKNLNFRCKDLTLKGFSLSICRSEKIINSQKFSFCWLAWSHTEPFTGKSMKCQRRTPESCCFDASPTGWNDFSTASRHLRVLGPIKKSWVSMQRMIGQVDFPKHSSAGRTATSCHRSKWKMYSLTDWQRSKSHCTSQMSQDAVHWEASPSMSEHVLADLQSEPGGKNVQLPAWTAAADSPGEKIACLRRLQSVLAPGMCCNDNQRPPNLSQVDQSLAAPQISAEMVQPLPLAARKIHNFERKTCACTFSRNIHENLQFHNDQFASCIV